jgi:hypothetical protein
MSARSRFRQDLVGDTSGREVGGARVALVVAAKAAAVSRINLAVAAVAIGCAAFWELSAALWAVPLSLAAVVVTKLCSAETWAAARRRRLGRPLSLPDPATLSDATAQTMARRLRQAREGLARAVDQAPSEVSVASPGRPSAAGGDPHGVLRGARDLERNAVVLIARLEYVSRFLSTVSLSALGNELDRLRSNERNALKAEARAAYQRAATRCAAHIGALRGLEAERERLVGNLEYLVGTLEAAPGELTRVELLRLHAADHGLADPLNDASHLFDDLKAVEEALDPTGS